MSILQFFTNDGLNTVSNKIVQYLPYHDLKSLISAYEPEIKYHFLKNPKLYKEKLLQYIGPRCKFSLYVIYDRDREYNMQTNPEYYRTHFKWFFMHYDKWLNSLIHRHCLPLPHSLKNKFFVPRFMDYYLVLDWFCLQGHYSKVSICNGFRYIQYGICNTKKEVFIIDHEKRDLCCKNREISLSCERLLREYLKFNHGKFSVTLFEKAIEYADDS